MTEGGQNNDILKNHLSGSSGQEFHDDQDLAQVIHQYFLKEPEAIQSENSSSMPLKSNQSEKNAIYNLEDVIGNMDNAGYSLESIVETLSEKNEK